MDYSFLISEINPAVAFLQTAIGLTAIIKIYKNWSRIMEERDFKWLAKKIITTAIVISLPSIVLAITNHLGG